jgi:hypothetical protein
METLELPNLFDLCDLIRSPELAERVARQPPVDMTGLNPAQLLADVITKYTGAPVRIVVPPPKRRSRAQPVTIPRVKRARRLAEAAGINPKNVTFNPDGSFTFGGAALVEVPVATPADTAASWDDV